MNVEGVRAFVAVAEEGQFRIAADRLGVTQQAVSKRIARLESALGTALFTRTPAGAVLTGDGRTFLPHARAVLKAVGDAVASVQPRARPLRVDVFGRRVAPAELFRAFLAANPDLPAEMVTGGRAAAIVGSVSAGEADAGYAYLRAPADPRLGRAYAYLEPVEVIAGPRHPVARQRAVPAAELARYRAWVPGIVGGSEWEAFYAELAVAFGLDIDPAGYTSGTESVFDAIADSASLLTFVGRKTRVPAPAHLGLARVAVVAPAMLYPWSLVWRSGTRHAGTLRLIAHVRQAFRPPDPAASWLPAQARADLG